MEDHGNVLLLNQGYQPIKTISWKRAICLYYLNKVEIVNTYPDSFINTVNEQYPVPAVVRLINYHKIIPHIIKFSRHRIYSRDNYQCQYCGKFCNKNQLTLDHVKPRSKGGKTSWENVVTACQCCNYKKRDRTPAEANMPLLTTPAKPKKYSDYNFNSIKIHPLWSDWINT